MYVTRPAAGWHQIWEVQLLTQNQRRTGQGTGQVGVSNGWGDEQLPCPGLDLGPGSWSSCSESIAAQPLRALILLSPEQGEEGELS